MRTIPLSPIDYVFTGEHAYPIQFAFYYGERQEAERLKASLQSTLELFFPLQQRLQPGGENNYSFVAAGEGFFLKEVDLSAADLPDLDDPISLIPYTDAIRSVPGEPLSKFRLTHFRKGSLLSANISHCLVDGYGFFFFLTSWAKRCRGEDIMAPDLEREKLIPTEVPTLSEANLAAELFEKTGFSYFGERKFGRAEDFRWKVLYFSPAEVLEALQKAGQETEIRLSKNDVLTTLLWKRFAKEHHRSGEQLSLVTAYDYRRGYSKLNPLFLSNSVRGVTVQMDRDEILNLSVAEIALTVRRVIGSIDEQRVEESLASFEALRRQKGIGAVQKMHVAHPESGFLTTNLSRVRLHELDFGLGKPDKFVALTQAPRTAVILADGDGFKVQVGLGY